MTSRRRPWLYWAFDVMALFLVGWFTIVLLFKGTGTGEEARWLDFVLGGVGALWFARLAKEVRRNWQLESRAGTVAPQSTSREP